MTTVYRRFIAGAMCPSCHSIDKLAYQKCADYQKLECVRCGFSDYQREPETPDLGER